MNAGSGIVHSERTDPSLRFSGGMIALACKPGCVPHEDEETAPGSRITQSMTLPELSEGVWARRSGSGAHHRGWSNGVSNLIARSICNAELERRQAGTAGRVT